MKIVNTLCLVLLLSVALGAQVSQTPPPDLKPDRIVRGQTLPSTHDPALSLIFDKAFKYAGSQRFTLYGVADAEQHFFVDSTPDGTIRRVYWVQFEGYLPTNEHTYQYKGEQVEIGGFPWFSDTRVRAIDPAAGRPDSDGAHVYALLLGKGLKLPAEVRMQRLVHLTDTGKRKELMIIYAENTATAGSDATMENLLEHAKAGMKIVK